MNSSFEFEQASECHKRYRRGKEKSRRTTRKGCEVPAPVVVTISILHIIGGVCGYRLTPFLSRNTRLLKSPASSRCRFQIPCIPTFQSSFALRSTATITLLSKNQYEENAPNNLLDKRKGSGDATKIKLRVLFGADGQPTLPFFHFHHVSLFCINSKFPFKLQVAKNAAALVGIIGGLWNVVGERSSIIAVFDGFFQAFHSIIANTPTHKFLCQGQSWTRWLEYDAFPSLT